jgi:hydrogenase expression/formation protein HypC
MCIGVPMQIVAVGAGGALCEGRGQRERIDLALVGEQPAGTWILVYRGCAVRTLTPDEATRTSAALAALEAVLAGSTDVDAYFADLVEREPTLPEHLKGAGG